VTNLDLKTKSEALSIAEAENLGLSSSAPNSKPPVARIMGLLVKVPFLNNRKKERVSP